MWFLNRFLDGVYCLNLPKSRDRRLKMESEFKKHNLKCQWISAISPQDEVFRTACKNPEQVDQTIRPRCYCVTPCHHKPRGLRKAEIAISLSHRLAYQKMMENNQDLALVCEDDVTFHPKFNEICQHLFTQPVINQLLSAQPYIVFFGANNNPNLSISQPKQFKLLPKRNGSYSNYCYLVNHSAAQLILKHFFPINRPEDSYKRYLIGLRLITCYQVTPALVGELSVGVNLPSIFDRLSRPNRPKQPTKNKIKRSRQITKKPTQITKKITKK